MTDTYTLVVPTYDGYVPRSIEVNVNGQTVRYDDLVNSSPSTTATPATATYATKEAIDVDE